MSLNYKFFKCYHKCSLTSLCVFVCARACVRMCVHACARVCIHIYIYIYMYISTFHNLLYIQITITTCMLVQDICVHLCHVVRARDRFKQKEQTKRATCYLDLPGKVYIYIYHHSYSHNRHKHTHKKIHTLVGEPM